MGTDNFFYSTRHWASSQKHLYWLFVSVLMIPNVFLFFTEDMSAWTRVPFLLMPAAFYMALMCMCRKPGWSAWILFPMFILGAFQLVLLYLFGRSIIASDMFLNLFTTNSGEVGELLGKLMPAIIGVCVLYIPTLAIGVYSARLKEKLPASFRLKILRSAAIVFALSLPFCLSGKFRITDDIFPANIFYNMGFAFKSWEKSVKYPQTSAGFTFSAVSERPDTLREVYVMVVGETARATNLGLYGYYRNTTPMLRKTEGLVTFYDALTQSNTTHKSVPMILSDISAENFSDIYARKGILTAFREAGFSTVFISNQEPNRSFIDYFAREADNYTNLVIGGHAAYDMVMVDSLARIIDRGDKKLLVVLHSHGSHFNYNERYPASGSYYKPDDVEVVSYREREKLINAYDNSIRYTDGFLSGLISVLEERNLPSALFYCSDHGEDLLDDSRRRFLHASPIPTYYQIHIPYLWWFSPSYRQLWPEKTAAAENNSHKPVSTRNVFHTMLSVAGINRPYANPCLSVADTSFIPLKRFYLNDHNLPVPLDSLHLKEKDIEMFREKGLSYP